MKIRKGSLFISATEVSRNFSEVVNEVYYSHKPKIVVKNKRKMVKIVPVEPNLLGKDLLELFQTFPILTIEEADDFLTDLEVNRKSLTFGTETLWD